MNKINIQPVATKMIVKEIPKDEEKLGSLIIPGTVNANLSRAEVIAVSKAKEMRDDNGVALLKEGDIVIYPQGSGAGQMIEGVHYQWLSLVDLWAIETKD